MHLIGDVGGTKIQLAICTTESGRPTVVREATYASADFARLEGALSRFLSGWDEVLESIVLAVAGPVEEGRAALTNLPWVIEERPIRDGFGVTRVLLLNDLLAVAHAVPLLGPEELETLQRGSGSARGPMGVVAPGTGLGEAFLTWNGGRHQPHPSEGGHADFAPATPLQLELLDYLAGRVGHVSYERVCSGLALPDLYAFLRDREPGREAAAVARRLATAEDRTPVIIEEAGRDPLCGRAVRLFSEVLAGEAGNMALRVLASGGIFLGGGLPPRLLPFLRAPEWLGAFRRKGRFARFLEDIPVHVILTPRAALIGAGRVAAAQSL